jgi:hypothetical protein
VTPPNEELLYFRYCRTLDGRLIPIDTAKHNGRLVPHFSPDQFTPILDHSDCEFEELIAEVCQNLTITERRTWLQLVDGLTILDIAAAERISRTAVYERIRGNSKGQGGMVAKNDYCRIWWERRQRKDGRLR